MLRGIEFVTLIDKEPIMTIGNQMGGMTVAQEYMGNGAQNANNQKEAEKVAQNQELAKQQVSKDQQNEEIKREAAKSTGLGMNLNLSA